MTGNDTGLSMFQTTGNTVQGNFIGTNEAGAASIPNRGGGITIIESSGNTVGGSVVEARNVISGNQRYGVGVFNNSPGNVIAGNWIGSSATGSPLGNQNDGVDHRQLEQHRRRHRRGWQPDRVERDQRRHDQ